MSDSEDHHRQLVEGATNEAGRRLGALRDDIISAVSTFDSEAHDATEDLKGKSESDTGTAIFKALLDVAVAAIPGAEAAKEAMKMLEEVGKEAVKSFAETLADGIQKSSEDSAKEHLDEAKSELRRIATKLSKDALNAAKEAYNKAEPLLGHSAEQVLQAHPDFADLELEQGNYGTIASRMGLPEPGQNRVSERISAALTKQFQEETKRVTANLDFMDLDGDDARLSYLIKKQATLPSGEFKTISDYLTYLERDVPWWMRRVDLYTAAFGKEEPTEGRMLAVLNAAHNDDADTEAVQNAYRAFVMEGLK